MVFFGDFFLDAAFFSVLVSVSTAPQMPRLFSPVRTIEEDLSEVCWLLSMGCTYLAVVPRTGLFFNNLACLVGL